MRSAHSIVVCLAVSVSLVMACGKSGESASPTSPTTTTTSTPSSPAASTVVLYSQFYGVQVSLTGSTATLQTTDIPDHPSPYFGVGAAMYEVPQAGMQVNPNRIATQNITMRVPLAPAISASTSDTPLGPIGIAVNGVVLFNQYAAGRQPLTFEILSFDRFNGHPSPANQYHYHVEPLWLTSTSRSRMLGVLLDGFPVYGPVDATGQPPSDLDVCHGHVGVTPEFANGIYHYHVTTEVPYISGCFRGTSGTIG